MTLTYFLTLLIVVIAAAGVTIALAVWANMPLMALGFAAVTGSLILGWNQLGR